MNVKRSEDVKVTVYVAGALAFALLLVSPAKADGMAATTIRGEVEAANYDEDGRVTKVAVYDDEWGAVLVLENGKGTELLKHVGVLVSATGNIRELDDDSGYSYAIEVTSYTIDEPAEPDEDPDHDPRE